VRTDGKWSLACDGEVTWERRFFQLWHPAFSPDTRHIAAIVSPKYGKWTVARDGKPWSVTFNDLITDLVFSPDSNRIAIAGKHNDKWEIAVDDRKWKNAFDMIGRPVFCPGSKAVAAKVERNGQYSVAVNDRVWREAYDAVWDPVFSPAGDKLLLRTLKDGKYTRRVISVNDILS
jgi:hypothetical protein